jgi:hypothetical protein
LERTTVFPLGAKPFRYAPKNDDDETQLLALGHTIAQQDKFVGDDEATGSVKSSDEQDNLLDSLDKLLCNGRTSPLPPAGEDSDGSTPLDYSGDNEEGSVNASDDNVEKAIEDDNATSEGQDDDIEALVEISASTKKPVLTQQIIMELVESQACSIRTP